MHEFPPNSSRAKRPAEEPKPEPREKIEPITTAGEIRRKKSLGRKFKSAFIEGSARGAMESMVGDVVVPTVRDMLFEAVQAGFEKLIYGESSRVRRGAPRSTDAYSNVGRFNYQGISSSNKPPEPRSISRRSRSRMDFGEVIIPTRQDAEEILERLYDELHRYESVPVAMVYELAGIQHSHTDFKWGWTSLRGAKVAKLRSGGYLLDLPEPISLER